MSRTSWVPPQLKLDAFSVAEAKEVGLTAKSLRSKRWRRIARGLYCWTEANQDPWNLLCAWQRKYPQAVFSTRTAAWLHGLDIDPVDPIEVVVPLRSGMRSRPGVRVRRSDMPPSDIGPVRALRATRLQRTFDDLSRRLARIEVLILADAALRRGLGRFDELAEPAESPMETRLRWLLMKAGLPRPEVQTNLHDANHRFIGRADLYYPASLLVVEYDGASHRERLVEDDRRQNQLLDAGYSVLRFTASDLSEPERVATLVRRALSAAAAASARPPAAARR